MSSRMLPNARFALALCALSGWSLACGDAQPAQMQADSAPTGRQALYVANGSLRTGSNQAVNLHGFNYFGFNNGQTMVDGLWGGPAVALDFATIVYRQQLLGFNAVRLPFSFKDLQNLKPRNFTAACTLASSGEVAQSALFGGASLPAQIPAQREAPPRQTKQCNEYLPNDTVWNRYKWVVRFYAHNGFYVLIDNHLREDKSALENSDAWAQRFAQLVAELSADSKVADRLLIDVLNEPDEFGLAWAPQNGKPGLGDLYFKAMDAIYRVAPKAIFALEGAGQGALQSNWGDGYATGEADIRSLSLSDPRPFFEKLRSKPYRSQVILAPHVYGPAVTTNNNAARGPELFARLTRSFGGLTKAGYCFAGKCDRYPVAIGEFGSKFTDARDVATMSDLSLYLRNQGAGNDGKHNAIGNWFYWSWNPNSGDTGGLVADDWVRLDERKLGFLKTLGLKPFSR